jgi:lipoprotein-anchoring transpeptidase ErfK/SrfK
MLLSIFLASFLVFPSTLSENTNYPEPILHSTQDEREEIPVMNLTNPEFELTNNWIHLIPGEIKESEWILIVDISKQKEHVFKNRKYIKSYIVSTGSATRYSYDATLKLGIWKVRSKTKSNLNDIYGPRLMDLDYWDESDFKKTNIALHGTIEPENLGQATSMGCIYHSNSDIIELYDLISVGTLVISVE